MPLNDLVFLTRTLKLNNLSDHKMSSLKLRKRISQILFHGSGKPVQSLPLDSAVNTLIFVNIFADIYYSYTQKAPEFHSGLILISGIIFGIEILLKLWTCVDLERYRSPITGRLKYCLHPLVILDILATIPMVASGGSVNTSFLRVFRVFDLGAYLAERDISPFTLVQASIIKRIPEITIIVFTLVALIIFSAFSYNLVEQTSSVDVTQAYRALPSIEMIISMLIGVESSTIQPSTEFGAIVLSITQVLGLFLVGLPTAIVTGSFVAEIQKVNELKKMREIETTLLNSFDVLSPISVRDLARVNSFSARARERTLDDLQYRLGLNIEDVKKAVSSFQTLKIRAVKDPMTNSNRVFVEQLPVNRLYGLFIKRKTNGVIITTQSAGEPALNHFVNSLAINLDFSVIANQIFSSGALNPNLRQNFASNPHYENVSIKPTKEVEEFVQDLESLLESASPTTVIYVSTMNARNKENFHISHFNSEPSAPKINVKERDDVLLKDWSEGSAHVLSFIASKRPKQIIKIVISINVLRSDDTFKYFNHLIDLNSMIKTTLSRFD